MPGKALGMNTSATLLSHKDIQSIDAAKLYYSGMSQQEVADTLHLSRPTISKLLSHAQEKGFVRITVHDPRTEDQALQERLIQRFGLSDVRVVFPGTADRQKVNESLGRAAADLLTSLVAEGDTIGVAWSRTVEAMSRALVKTPRRNVKVVQIRGGVGAAETGFSEISTINRFAEAFEGEPHMLALPTVFETVQVKTAVEKERQVVEVLEMGRTARFAVFTVGEVSSDAYMMQLSALRPEERELLLQRSCGDICSRFVDGKGRICLPDLNSRTVSISLPHLRRVPQKLLVVGGEEKAEIAKVALSYGYVSHLVIDAATAMAILD
ncbi:putative deoxyribonucleoside regulator [Gleimia coleocanis DSM 15436]|uniref:Putative deoxyribonucleoside regulator n=1 Tax=Gleimia coleocanis DSM 15436 TaxID=525245 RepID=C0W0V8_9ACTO|nr:sugar-binding domain-containing protein [Gleimia coleocanis]EEH63682.1 putative deoxyribonucleoside regulator [Gleimia coleocanis DSM 15436]